MRIDFKLVFFVLLFSITAFCQTEQLKWQKADISYEKENNFRHRDYSFQFNDAGEVVKKSLAMTYWFFISDVDGDNCPFRPSCSSFLIDAAKETNILQTSLMFFDRFTRDMNVFKRKNHYPRVKDGHYYDPPLNYTLSETKIQYIPASSVVKE